MQTNRNSLMGEMKSFLLEKMILINILSHFTVSKNFEKLKEKKDMLEKSVIKISQEAEDKYTQKNEDQISDLLDKINELETEIRQMINN